MSAAGVQFLLFEFTLSATIIFGTSRICFCLSMRSPAAKGASKIITAGVSGIGEEKNAAMPASFQTFS